MTLNEFAGHPERSALESLSAITRHMRRTPARLAWHHDRVATFGAYNDYFYSFAFWRDTLYSLNARDMTATLDRIGQPDFHDDQIILTRYEWSGGRYRVAEQRDLGFGGDPRVVSDGARAFALILGTYFSSAKVYLYDFAMERRLPITVDDRSFDFGKNWQPFLRDGELFVVHQLAPTRVLKVDIATGHAVCVAERELDFKLTASYQPFPLFRGGANAMVLGDDIVGLGRTTANRVHHTPFFWSLDDDLHIDIIFTELFQTFVELGYGIIDPTSFFIHDGDLYVGLACSERNWAHTQIVSDYLLVFPGADGMQQHPLWADYVRTRQKVTQAGKADLRRHMFQCTDMPQTREFRHDLGGVISDGQPGHLIYGPYVPIEDPGPYSVEFSFLTLSDRTGQIGVFEASVFDGEMLGETAIMARPGTIGTARIDFDVPKTGLGRLETRVGLDAGALISAYHVRIWRRDLAASGDPDHPWADIFWTQA